MTRSVRSGARVTFVCSLLAVSLVACGCATKPSGAFPGDTSPGLLEQSFPDADIDAQFHVLAGEMAAQRGMKKAAARHYAAAAEYTSNAGLARRATRIGLMADSMPAAYKAAQQWARLEPGTVEAQQTAARLALIEGQAEVLLQYSRATVSNAESRREGYHLLAKTFSGKPQRAELALDTLQQLADADTDSAAAWHVLGLLALRYGREETAATASRRAVELAPTRDKVVLLRAAVLVRQDRSSAAQQLVEQLPGDAQQRSRYHLTLARLLLDGNRPEAALDEFGHALELQPDNTNARYGLAMLALRQGQLERSATAFEHLYEADERTNEAAYYLGRINEQRQEYAVAQRWYQRVEGGDHEFAARIGLVRMRARRDDLAGARRQLHDMREQYPQKAEQIRGAEGRILFDAERFEQALAVYDEGLEHKPESTDLLYGRAIVYEKLERIDAALHDLNTILAAKPDDIHAMNALGYMMTNHGTDYEAALEYIEEALARAPNNPAIMDSMGWVQYHLGNLDKAQEYLERAYRLLPDPEVAAHLGEVLWQNGRHEEARRIWSESLVEHPDDELLKETMDRFTS